MTTTLIDRMLKFLGQSPTPLHATQVTAEILQQEGFSPLYLTEDTVSLSPGDRYFIREGGSIFAFCVGTQPCASSGFHIASAHTDSPNLRIKPQPIIRNNGYVRLGVEVYGGAIVPTWVDRDLGLAGQITLLRDGKPVHQLIHIKEPICRVPSLAIHLNRKVNDEGLKVNAQTQLPALLSLDDSKDENPFLTVLAEAAQCDTKEIRTWDLSLFDLAPPTLGGANKEFVFSARLDNLASCHSILEGFCDALRQGDPDKTVVLALFDHEEIGSHTVRGADSQLLEYVLRRILDGRGASSSSDFSRAIAHSWLISADMAHAVHPAFPKKHDSQHMPAMNGGPTIKQHASYRYGTESGRAAEFQLLCEQVGAPVQYYSHRSDLRCGTTVGPLVASQLAMHTIDVGNPMLSMHSAREMCGVKDHQWMTDVLSAFFQSP